MSKLREASQAYLFIQQSRVLEQPSRANSEKKDFNVKKELVEFSVADIHSSPKDYKDDACCVMIYYSLALLHGLNSHCLPQIFICAQNQSAFLNPGRSLRDC